LKRPTGGLRLPSRVVVVVLIVVFSGGPSRHSSLHLSRSSAALSVFKLRKYGMPFGLRLPVLGTWPPAACCIAAVTVV